MKQNSPGISIAMTTCNGGAYVREQLESLLAQTLPPVEIVVCDDASTDDTPAVLRAYARNGHIRLYENVKRIGIIENFRQAVGLCADNTYIALCDQDDIWLPGKLEANSLLLQSIDDGTTCTLIYSDLQLVDGLLQLLHPSFWKVLNIDPARESLSSLLFGNFITGCTVMMNDAMRRAFCDMPADDRVMMHDAWLALIGYSFGRAAFDPQPLVRYRQHGSNVTFETNRGSTFAGRLHKSIVQMGASKQYLRRETAQAALFAQTYRSRISEEQRRIFDRFTGLAAAPFLRKKIASLAARHYRYTS